MIGVYTSVLTRVYSPHQRTASARSNETRTKPRLTNTGTDASAPTREGSTHTRPRSITSPPAASTHPSIFAAVTPSVRVPYAVTQCPKNMSSSSKYTENEPSASITMLLSLIRRVKLSSVISGTSSSAESRHSHASSVSSRAANARMSRSGTLKTSHLTFFHISLVCDTAHTAAIFTITRDSSPNPARTETGPRPTSTASAWPHG